MANSINPRAKLHTEEEAVLSELIATLNICDLSLGDHCMRSLLKNPNRYQVDSQSLKQPEGSGVPHIGDYILNKPEKLS